MEVIFVFNRYLNFSLLIFYWLKLYIENKNYDFRDYIKYKYLYNNLFYNKYILI